ncbi:hypothetical protein Pfo_011349, partial [Paulownia fortunei]
MARINFSLFLVSFLLGLVVSSGIENSNMADPISHQSKTWCMTKVSAPSDKLQGFIDYACGQFSCKEIQPGGTCYEPNTLQSHASYALDIVYQARGWCNPEIGTTTVTDPCKLLLYHYPFHLATVIIH